jgi:hypothetical protein
VLWIAGRLLTFVAAGSATAGFIITDASVARIGRVAKIPVGLVDERCRRGGNGGSRLLQAAHAVAPSIFSALQNGQKRMRDYGAPTLSMSVKAVPVCRMSIAIAVISADHTQKQSVRDKTRT